MKEHPELSDGHGRIANEIMDALAATYMSSYESQFLWCLFRKTYGWSKKEDFIALSQIAAATGMHLSHVSRTKKKLLHRRIVTQTGNKIAFNKYYSQWQRLPKRVTVTQTGNRLKPPAHSGKSPPPIQVIDPPPVQAGTKETLTKETLTTASGAIAPPRKTPRVENEEFFANPGLQSNLVDEICADRGEQYKPWVQNQMEKFVLYWTEKTPGGKKVLWQTKKTFEVRRRFFNWLHMEAERMRNRRQAPGSLSMPEGL